MAIVAPMNEIGFGDNREAATPWPAFEVVNPAGGAGALVICDHASAAIPPELAGLGLARAELERHIAWDIGAADVARRLAGLLEVPAVLSATSRLVVDCNRLEDDPSAIPELSDGTAIPGNRNLDLGERRRRHRLYARPYQDEVARRLARSGPATMVISVHSFTPTMDGFERPWHVGILHDGDPETARRVIAELARDPSLVVGDNQPYSGGAPEGYGLEIYGNEGGHRMAMFEIRQDLIATAEGAEAWAQILRAALAPLLAPAPTGA